MNEAMVAEALPRMRKTAAYLAYRCRSLVSAEELESVGHEAIYRAADRYDSSRCTHWLSWSNLCARRAMVDWIRGPASPLTRGQQLRGESPPMQLSRLFAAFHNGIEPVQFTDPRPGPERHQQHRDLVAVALRVLALRERLIVLLKFHEGFTEREIAVFLSLSESCVNKLFAASLKKIRRHIGHRKDEL
jgi:RNA polymerase sigma factor (sigma-70 family)